MDTVLVVLAAAAATALLAGRVRSGASERALTGAMFALACLVVVGGGSLAERGLAALVAPDGDLARTAVARSAVLAAAAVVLASCGRLSALSGLARLAYPVFVFSALKLLFEDFPQGRPGTLVATFVLYGVALTVLPRILRSERP